MVNLFLFCAKDRKFHCMTVSQIEYIERLVGRYLPRRLLFFSVICMYIAIQLGVIWLFEEKEIDKIEIDL